MNATPRLVRGYASVAEDYEKATPTTFRCGHPRTDENTIMNYNKDGYVAARCLECHRVYVREWTRKQRAKS